MRSHQHYFPNAIAYLAQTYQCVMLHPLSHTHRKTSATWHFRLTVNVPQATRLNIQFLNPYEPSVSMRCFGLTLHDSTLVLLMYATDDLVLHLQLDPSLDSGDKPGITYL